MHCSQIIRFLHNTDCSSESSSDDETSSSSSSSESDSFLYDLDILAVVSRKTKRNFIATTVNKYTDDEFLGHFKMGRDLADTLILEIKAANILPTHIFGRKKITAKKALLMTIWYLVHQETFRQLSERWDVSFSSAHRVVTKIFDYFISNTANHIRWPRGERARLALMKFSQEVGIHGVIGAIGELHVPIRAIRKSYHVYMNRDGYHSVLLQAVCDHELLFTDIYCGEPGSLTEPTVLDKSPLYTAAAMASSDLFDDTVLIGDYGYPNLPWLVPPFDGPLTDDQHLFNSKHAIARSVIDRAFNSLTTRFTRLTNFNNLSIEFIVKGITASCVLHNICVRNQQQLIQVPDDSQTIDEEHTKYGLSEYFTERAGEYEQRRREKMEEMCRNERRHFEKLKLLQKRRDFEQQILKLLKHSKS